jgi:hypothetical protein
VGTAGMRPSEVPPSRPPAPLAPGDSGTDPVATTRRLSAKLRPTQISVAVVQPFPLLLGQNPAPTSKRVDHRDRRPCFLAALRMSAGLWTVWVHGTAVNNS